MLLHASFNASSFASLVIDTRAGQKPSHEPIPLAIALGGTAAALLLGYVARQLAQRSEVAAAARQRDRA